MVLSEWSISYYIGWSYVMMTPLPLLESDRGIDRVIIISSFPKTNVFSSHLTNSLTVIDFLLFRSISTIKFLSCSFSWELFISYTKGYWTKMANFLLLANLIKKRMFGSYLSSLKISSL